MKLKKLLAIILTVTLASLTLTSIASAQIPTPDPIVVTVPVFGTSMTITIVTDAATGDFQSATIVGADNADVTADFVQTTENEHGGFEVKFFNGTDGVEIEVNVADGDVIKVEIERETITPGDAGGPGVWIGDPLGNGDTITINYEVVVDPATGEITITAIKESNGSNTFLDAGEFASRSQKGETEATFTFFVWDSGTVDPTSPNQEILAGSQNSIDLVIKAEVEHGRLKVDVKTVDPSSNKGDDDRESDDRESDGRESDDRGDDDRESDDRGDNHESDDRESDDRGDDDRGDDDRGDDDRGDDESNDSGRDDNERDGGGDDD